MPYVVSFQLKGLGQAVAQLNAVASAAQNAQRALGGQQGASGGGRGSGTVQNAQAQALRMQAQMNRASAQLINSQISLANAQKRLANFLNPSGNPAAKKIMSAILTSRIGFGPNGITIMPLVSKLIPILAELGPVGWAAAAGLAALTAQILAAMHAMTYGVGFAKAYFQGGGSIADTARLSGIGAAAGYSPQDMSGMARQYNEALKNNPYAAGVAQAHGYGPNYAGVFGDINDSKRFYKAIQDAINAPTDLQAERQARNTPVENFLWLRKTSPDVRKQFMDQMRNSQSPQQQTQAVDAQARLNIVMSQFSLLLVKIGNVVLPIVNTVLKFVVDNFKAVAIVMALLSPGFIVVAAVMTLVAGVIILLVKGLVLLWKTAQFVWEYLKWLFGGMQGKRPTFDPAKAQADVAKAQRDATNRNTDAVNQNTRAMTNQRQVYGGGQYAQTAIPGNYFQPNNYEYSKSQVNLGQIPL